MTSQGFTYAVDLVLVIDATGSMGGTIDRVKAGALRFHDELGKVMAAKDKHVDELRVRVVVFRDYYAGDEEPLVASDFFELPGEQEKYARFVDSIVATGGGDEPENSLEGLVEAMRSPWTTSGTKRRHIIVMWTDASSHPVEKNAGRKPSNYPVGVPADFDGLTDLWEGQEVMDANAKRLVLFAPDAYAWTDISNHWESVLHYASNAGMGLSDIDYGTILESIANSV
ncbi:vWA domain-containing protein [Streptomyces sp. NPDC001002]